MSPYRERVPEPVYSWWERLQEWYRLKLVAYRQRGQPENSKEADFRLKYGFVLHCPGCHLFVENDILECVVVCHHCSGRYRLETWHPDFMSFRLHKVLDETGEIAHVVICETPSRTFF